MAIHLGRASPRASSNQPGRRCENAFRPTAEAAGLCRPYSVLLPAGFALPALLPALRCALTAPFHPYPIFGQPRSALLETPNVNGLNWAVCFLWHFPWGRPRRTLSGAVFPWSPDFPPPEKRYDLAAHNAPFRQRPSGQLTFRVRGYARAASSGGGKNARSFLPRNLLQRRRSYLPE